MSFSYHFAGIDIRSDAAIVGLRSDEDSADPLGPPLSVTHAASPAPMPDHIVYAWSGRYATRLGTVGDDWLIDSKLDGVFRVDRAIRTLRLLSADEHPSAASLDILVRRVLPRLMAARGALTIHAAAVAVEGAALLLLGNSGAGKSTTTAALATMPGWDMLSDDLSMIWQRAVPVVAPGATGVCLWSASRDGLGIDPALCHAMPGYDGKFRFEPAVSATTKPVPLRALVFLSREDVATPRLTPMTRTEAFVAAARQIVLFNPAAPPAGEHAAAIARLNRIVGDVPAVRLSYPSRFEALPAVAETLAGLVRG